MKNKIFAIVGFVVLCFGSVVFAGQNTNSSTMQNMNDNMSDRGDMRGMRHRRHKHRKHRRHRAMKMKMKMTNGNDNQ
ncbi:MAG: hypothetical protein M3R67_07540 [Acidobacteriota bacterium]|nr:hypothetical protein [Acidobacteriota bacterium]